MTKRNDGYGGKLSDFDLAAARLLLHRRAVKKKYRKGHDEKRTPVANDAAATSPVKASKKTSVGITIVS